jgi:hypothetical protein
LTVSESGSGVSLIEFSNAKTRPAATLTPKTTYPLASPLITVRLSAAPTFARVRDAAGNWSSWVAVSG